MFLLKRLFTSKVRSILGALGAIALISAPYWILLNSLTGGLSEAEMQLQYQVSSNQLSFSQIIIEPFFLLYNLLLLVLQTFSLPTMDNVRLVSAVFGTAGVIGFYYVAKTWYSPRVAILGSVLFGTATWTLFTARYASVEASYLMLPALIAAWTWTIKSHYNYTAVITTAILTISVLYIPGMIWLITPVLFWQFRNIAFFVTKLNPAHITAVFAVILVGITPLIAAIVFPPENSTGLSSLLTLLGLPQTIPAISAITESASTNFMQMFVTSEPDNFRTIGTLPLIDVFTTAMIVIGLWTFYKEKMLDRGKITTWYLLVGFILASLNGQVYITILLPVLYLIAATGLWSMLHQWLSVFPRNPFARPLGLFLMSAAIIVVSFFHLMSYFVAWPHTKAAVQAFHLSEKN